MNSPQWVDGTLLLTFDLQVYKLDSVKKAVYKFTDRCRVELGIQEITQLLEVRLTLLKPLSVPEQDMLASHFLNEVLDQDLRDTLFQETEAVRNLILAQAFSKTSLLDG